MKDKKIKQIEDLTFNQLKSMNEKEEEKFEYDLIKILKMFNKGS